MSIQPKSPYARAKKLNLFGRCTVDDLKKEIKNEFKMKLKENRHKNIDNRRKSLFINEVVQQGYSEICASLLGDKEAVEFLDKDRLINLLDDVQTELSIELSIEAERYEKDVEDGLNFLVNSNLINCSVCDKILDNTSKSNALCGDCGNCFVND